jgi:hypothetical protein
LWLFVPLALYRVLKGVDQTLAVVLVILGSGPVAVPIRPVEYRSRFLPRFLGIWPILAGFAWLAGS